MFRCLYCFSLGIIGTRFDLRDMLSSALTDDAKCPVTGQVTGVDQDVVEVVVFYVDNVTTSPSLTLSMFSPINTFPKDSPSKV